MADESKVRARFQVTAKRVDITGGLEEITFSISWPRHDRPEQTAAHLRALLATLPSVVRDGINEVVAQDGVKNLDAELEELLNPKEDRGE